MSIATPNIDPLELLMVTRFDSTKTEILDTALQEQLNLLRSRDFEVKGVITDPQSTLNNLMALSCCAIKQITMCCAVLPGIVSGLGSDVALADTYFSGLRTNPQCPLNPPPRLDVTVEAFGF
jgi:hypothetical protein